MNTKGAKNKFGHIDSVVKKCEERAKDVAIDTGKYFLNRYKKTSHEFVVGALILRLNEVIDDEHALRKCLMDCSEKMETIGSIAHPGRKNG